MSSALRDACDEASTLGWEPWHASAGCSSSPLKLLFTVDEPTDLELEAMGRVCAACPALSDCQAAVRAQEPDCGFWAGQFYGGDIVPSLIEVPRLRPVVPMTVEQKAAFWEQIGSAPHLKDAPLEPRQWLVPLPDPIPAPDAVAC